MTEQPWHRRWWNLAAAELLAGASVVGVYLDRTGLTLARLEKGLTSLRLTALTRLDGDPAQPDTLAPALRAACAPWAPARPPVYVAVSRDLGFWRQMKLPAAARENLAQVVSYELDRFLPLPADAVYYDFQLVQETADHLLLALMAAPRKVVDDCLELLREMGLQVAGVELETTAAANAFGLLTEQLPAAWVMVHLGAKGLETLALRNRTLIAHSQTTSAAERQLPGLLAAELARLREGGLDPEGLCVYSAPERSQQTARLAEGAGLPAFTIARLKLEGLAADAEASQALPALGAALRGARRAPLAANLLPAEARDQVKSGAQLLNKFFLMGFVALLCIWIGSVIIHQRVALYQVNRELAGLSAQARELEQRLKESKVLTDQLAAFRQKLGQYPDKLKILRELTRLIPDHTYIFHLRLSQNILEISGMSKSAADLIPLLEQSGWLTKTEFASPIVTDATKLEHFKIKAEIKSVEPAS